MTREAKSKIGTVLKKSGDKTVVVLVERLVQHPRFKKYVTKRKKFHVHDEKNEVGAGDKVKISEHRPLSKTKKWNLHSIIEKAK